MRKWRFSDGREFDLAGAGELERKANDTVVRLLSDLQALSRSKSSSRNPSVEDGWIVAINQQKFGPYDTATLAAMIETEQVDRAAFIWRPGMVAWVPVDGAPGLDRAATSGEQAVPRRPSVAQARPTAHDNRDGDDWDWDAPPQPVAARPNAIKRHGKLFRDREGEPSVRAPRRGETRRRTRAAAAGGSKSHAVQNEPLIDVNNAPVDDLLTLPGITLADAERLIIERQSRLGFGSPDDIGTFLGFPPHAIQRLRERVALKPFVGAGPVTSARRRVVDF